MESRTEVGHEADLESVVRSPASQCVEAEPSVRLGTVVAADGMASLSSVAPLRAEAVASPSYQVAGDVVAEEVVDAQEILVASPEAGIHHSSSQAEVALRPVLVSLGLRIDTDSEMMISVVNPRTKEAARTIHKSASTQGNTHLLPPSRFLPRAHLPCRKSRYRRSPVRVLHLGPTRSSLCALAAHAQPSRQRC